ncbi:MAG TPA: YfiR family protein [Lacunisphaera sp.]|jgi:hypothetical protein|nr:YfiR family protein [Lacunisphaera sp.]
MASLAQLDFPLGPPVDGRVRGRPGWCGRWLLLACLLAGPALAQPSREYDLKAVFLYNFATFVEWPQDVFATPDAPFVIGILGESPFGKSLDDVIAGEKVGAHPLVVRQCRSVWEARQCQIVFISGSEAPVFRSVLVDLRNRPVLTVSDIPGFADAGGIIEFSTRVRVNLTINARAARRAQLGISSKLLRLARVQEDTP